MGAFQSTNNANIVGAYGYNGCSDFSGALCNALCCGGKARWYVGGGGCIDDSRAFLTDSTGNDAAWQRGGALRTLFEARLFDAELTTLMKSAPRNCCGCMDPEKMGPVLNGAWCAKVNAELLHRAGYACHAEVWVTYNNKGEKHAHMQMQITRHQEHVSVHVPPGTAPGALLQVQAPGGALLQVAVPQGVAPGGSFIIALPPAAQPAMAAQPAAHAPPAGGIPVSAQPAAMGAAPVQQQSAPGLVPGLVS
jgi:hypothetical protein